MAIHLAAELIRRAGLALADALDLGRMQRIDLGAALALVLAAHPLRQGKQRGEARFQRRIAVDLAADVADHPAKSGAQELELAPGALELMRVGIAADHDRGALGHPAIALAQRHTLRLASSTSLFMARCISRASVGCATAFGCTVVSTATRSRSLVADGAGLVRHRQAFLEQRDELLLAQPLAPTRHR